MSAPSLDELLAREEPLLALAPMQDVTDLPFWRLMTRYSGADVYYTEYFRVHRDYHIEKSILKSITQNPTGRPAIAQMIGNDIPSLVRTAKELLQHPVAAIDLNLDVPRPLCIANARVGDCCAICRWWIPSSVLCGKRSRGSSR